MVVVPPLLNRSRLKMVIGFYAGVAENTDGGGTNIRFNPKKREKTPKVNWPPPLPFTFFYLLPHLQHLRGHLKTSIVKVAVQTQFYWNGPSPAGKRGTESSEVIGFSTTQEHCGMVSWSRFSNTCDFISLWCSRVKLEAYHPKHHLGTLEVTGIHRLPSGESHRNFWKKANMVFLVMKLR